MAVVEVIYLVALIGVVVAIFALLGEAVMRSPSWQTQRFELGQHPAQPVPLQVVATVDRRAQPLDFVGEDRRAATAGGPREPDFVATRA